MRQGWVVTFRTAETGNGREWVSVPGSAFRPAELLTESDAKARASAADGEAVFVTEMEWPGVLGWVYAVTDTTREGER